MAVVETYCFGSRVVSIADDCFAGVSAEELRQRSQNAQDVIGSLMYQNQLRKLENQQAGTGSPTA